MASVIPEWADKKAEQVMTMFPRGDTAEIDRALLHGAFAAALVEERDRSLPALILAEEALSRPEIYTAHPVAEARIAIRHVLSLSPPHPLGQ